MARFEADKSGTLTDVGMRALLVWIDERKEKENSDASKEARREIRRQRKAAKVRT